MNFKSSQRWHIGEKPLKLICFLKIINIFLVIGIKAAQNLLWLFLFCDYSLPATAYGFTATVCPFLLP